MSSSKRIKSKQRRTSFFSHHPRVSGSCCANSWDRFTAQKMRYPLPPSVRNTKKLARNLRNLIKWTFSSTWAALSSIIASCAQAKQKRKEYLSYKKYHGLRNYFCKHQYVRNEKVNNLGFHKPAEYCLQVRASERKKEELWQTNSDWSNTRIVFLLNSLPIQFKKKATK